MRIIVLLLFMIFYGCKSPDSKVVNRIEATIKMEQKVEAVEQMLREACDSGIAKQAKQQFTIIQQQKTAIKSSKQIKKEK